jgi:hypothetical protein
VTSIDIEVSDDPADIVEEQRMDGTDWTVSGLYLRVVKVPDAAKHALSSCTPDSQIARQMTDVIQGAACLVAVRPNSLFIGAPARLCRCDEIASGGSISARGLVGRFREVLRKGQPE